MSESNSPQQKNIKIITTREPGQSRVYANYIEVTNNTIDVSIKFCDVRPPANSQDLKEAQEDGYMEVPIEVEVALPRSVAEDLVKVLQVQLKRGQGKGN